MTKGDIQLLYEYDRWANNRVLQVVEAPNTRFEPRCDTSRVVGKQEVSRVADQEKSNFRIDGHSGAMCRLMRSQQT
jgi:hypothetical protein